MNNAVAFPLGMLLGALIFYAVLRLAESWPSGHEYGSCFVQGIYGSADYLHPARRNRRTGEVQFLLRRRGEKEGSYVHDKDIWHAFASSHWGGFKPYES